MRASYLVQRQYGLPCPRAAAQLAELDLVLPELASAYADRSWVRPGMTCRRSGVRAFADIGWTWAGTWRRSQDFMHFSMTGD